jgi:hypothetical protein
MLIGYILISILIFMIYVYIGLRLVEPIKNPNIYIYFWVAYIIFGITIFNMIVISNFWSKLSTKVGPPGARGARGNDGELGINGECSADHNKVYVEKEIKENIVNMILSSYDDLKKEDLIDSKTLKLKNNFLNYRIKLMIESKQFETVLLTPSDNNDNKEENKIKIFGKSIEELAGYLSNIWVEWINLIISTDKVNARTLFTSLDAQIDVSDKINKIFTDEIMKYDVWYWGSTRIFRPLQAEICRKEYIDEEGNTYNNSIYPMNNKPRLEMKELEFSDVSIKTDVRFVKVMSLDLTRTTGDMSKYNSDFNRKYDLLSRYKKPVFYLPKVYIHEKTSQRYYPIGCVIVDDDSTSNEIRKTILVSGDIVIPDKKSIKEVWNNKITITDDFRCDYKYRRKRGARRTENKSNSTISKENYDVYLTDDLIAKKNNFNINNDVIFNKRLLSDKNDMKAILEINTDIPKYKVIGYLPTECSFDASNKLTYDIVNNVLYLKKDDEQNYSGIVGIPVSALEKIEDYDIEFSYRLDKLMNKTYESNIYRDIPKPVGESKYNKNFRIVYKRVNRTLQNYNEIDILKDKVTNIFNIRTRNKNSNADIYRIKEDSYKMEKYPIKELDPQYSDLGFGWFGYPIKKYRKYSIFAYLGLMPEGIIVHRSSGRKFYFRHYGGVEPNKFIIYLWNSDNKNYTNSLKVVNNEAVVISKARTTDPRYQFKVNILTDDPNYFTLSPIEYPSRYLTFNFKVNKDANLELDETNTRDESLKNKRPDGINLDHTKMYIGLTSQLGMNMPNNTTLFYNQPAYGTNVNIINEKMARNIDRSKSPQEQYNQLKKLDKNKNFNYIYKDNLPIDINNESHPDSILNY